MDTWKNNRKIDYGTWKNETFGVWKTQENYDEWVKMKLNEHKVYFTDEEIAQREKHSKEMKRRYYLASKERISKEELRKQWAKDKQRPHVCAVCGDMYNNNNKRRHIKTQKHLDSIVTSSPVVFPQEKD